MHNFGTFKIHCHEKKPGYITFLNVLCSCKLLKLT